MSRPVSTFLFCLLGLCAGLSLFPVLPRRPLAKRGAPRVAPAVSAPPPVWHEAAGRVHLELEPPQLSLARAEAPDPARLAAALEGALDPTELGLRLEQHLLRHPEDARLVLERLAQEPDLERAFRLALALARHLDDPALRAATLERLPSLTSALQQAALAALAGRREPEVLATLRATLSHPDPVLAGRAAEVLGLVTEALDPDAAQEALSWARRTVGDPHAPAPALVGAAALLGPLATPADAQHVADALLTAPAPEALHALAGALAQAGATPGELEAALERAASQGRPAAREAARALLARLATR